MMREVRKRSRSRLGVRGVSDLDLKGSIAAEWRKTAINPGTTLHEARSIIKRIDPALN
jgi:hypothetical protein